MEESIDYRGVQHEYSDGTMKLDWDSNAAASVRYEQFIKIKMNPLTENLTKNQHSSEHQKLMINLKVFNQNREIIHK